MVRYSITKRVGGPETFPHRLSNLRSLFTLVSLVSSLSSTLVGQAPNHCFGPFDPTEAPDSAKFDVSTLAPLRWSIEPGFGLRDDGRGPFIHGRGGEFGVLYRMPKLQACLGRDRCGSQRRFIQLDLSQPVAASGAEARGIVASVGGAGGQVWVFHGVGKTGVADFRDIPKSQTVSGGRLLIFFSTGDERFVLVAGAIGETQCGGFPISAFLGGEGTTQPLISRISDTEWLITLPRNSIARLWKWAGENSLPLGTYLFSARVRIGFRQ